MTPLPTVSPVDHPCTLCGETIPAGALYAGANDRPYHAHTACQDVVSATGQPFPDSLASLSRSDLCEILQAHSADELVRICNIQTNPLLVRS